MNLDVLAIGAHADDVEISCGGTVALLVDQGYQVGIADLTQALLATRGDPLTRDDEATDASKILGVHKRFQVGLKEGSLQATTENMYEIVTLIRSTKPHLILAPYWEDRHPDHSDTSRLVQAACFWSGIARYGDSQPPHRPHRTLYYYMHWDGPVSIVVDISSTFDRKLQSIRCYRSQFQSYPGDRSATFISRPEFLENIINRARNYGSMIGTEYGEGFHVRETNRVEDLMTWANTQGMVG